MEIHGPHGVSSPHPLLRRSLRPTETQRSGGYADQVDFSAEALALLDSPREARIARIRDEIARGTYDTVERLAAAVSILVERLELEAV